MKVAAFSVLAGVLAAAVIGTGPLEATAQQNQLMGCVKQGTGLLRIPAPNEGCKANETPLSFSDFPLLVALRDHVQQLQQALDALEARVTILEACASTVCRGQ